jgi:hypothetical protein
LLPLRIHDVVGDADDIEAVLSVQVNDVGQVHHAITKGRVDMKVTQ